MTDAKPDVVVHVASWAWTLGGLQSLLHRHQAEPTVAGGPTVIVVGLFDRAAPADAALAGRSLLLRARGGDTVAELRRRFAALVAPYRGAVFVYHDGWGLPWWADVDGAVRRVWYLHTETPNLPALLRTHGPRCDGILTVSHRLAELAQAGAAGLPAGRVAVLPSFVDPPPAEAARAAEQPSRSTAGRPWRIGYAGRLVRAHKRVDRFPALVAALDALGLDYELELMGDGDLAAPLRRTLGGHPRVQVLATRSGADYWATLATWDGAVLVSDFEGFSRFTMEAMTLGALPVHPAFSPAAAEMLGPLAERALYPPGDMPAAARRIAAQAGLTAVAREQCRALARARFATHTPGRYDAAYDAALARIGALPPRARPTAPARWESWLPLGLHTRLRPHRF